MPGRPPPPADPLAEAAPRGEGAASCRAQGTFQRPAESIPDCSALKGSTCASPGWGPAGVRSPLPNLRRLSARGGGSEPPRPPAATPRPGWPRKAPSHQVPSAKQGQARWSLARKAALQRQATGGLHCPAPASRPPTRGTVTELCPDGAAHHPLAAMPTEKPERACCPHPVASEIKMILWPRY